MARDKILTQTDEAFSYAEQDTCLVRKSALNKKTKTFQLHLNCNAAQK